MELDNLSINVTGRNTSDFNSTLFDIDDPGRLVNLLTTIFVPLVFGVIVFVGAFGNVLVITVVATNQTMRNTTNVLILNLAVADLLFIVFCVPFTATDYALNYWPFGLTWCQAVQYLIYVTSYISIYTLILMSIDRFLAVVCPVSSLGSRTVFNAGLAIFATWTVVACLSVPIWMAHHLKVITDENSSFAENKPSSEILFSNVTTADKVWCRFAEADYSQSGFQISFFVSGYAIPLLLIIILYLCMLKRLWHPVGNKISRESLRNKRRVTRLVLVIIVVFAVCWAPIQFVLLFKAMDSYSTKKVDRDYSRILFQVFAHVLAYLNSCINPILYAFLSDNFRKAFYHLLPACLRSGDVVRPALRYELTTLKSSFRASSRETGRRPFKRRCRQQDNSYEESIGLDKSHVTFRLNKLDETTCGDQEFTRNADGQVTVTAVVVVNHLDGIEKNNAESVVGAAKAIAQELTDRQLIVNGKIEMSVSTNDNSTSLSTQRHPRPQILTFDEKRKRAKLVVISASKLNGESLDNQTEEDNDEENEASEEELPLGDTVHKDTNGRGKVLCTRL